MGKKTIKIIGDDLIEREFALKDAVKEWVTSKLKKRNFSGLFAYSHTGETQSGWEISASQTPNSIVMRDSNGNIAGLNVKSEKSLPLSENGSFSVLGLVITISGADADFSESFINVQREPYINSDGTTGFYYYIIADTIYKSGANLTISIDISGDRSYYDSAKIIYLDADEQNFSEIVVPTYSRSAIITLTNGRYFPPFKLQKTPYNPYDETIAYMIDMDENFYKIDNPVTFLVDNDNSLNANTHKATLIFMSASQQVSLPRVNIKEIFLTEGTLSDTLTTTSVYLRNFFKDCQYLEKLDLSRITVVPSITSRAGLHGILAGFCQGCSRLVSAKLPKYDLSGQNNINNLADFYNGTFSECTSLREVTLYDNNDAPVADNLTADNCCMNMYYGCTQIEVPVFPLLPTVPVKFTSLFYYSYSCYNCSSMIGANIPPVNAQSVQTQTHLPARSFAAGTNPLEPDNPMPSWDDVIAGYTYS